MIESKSHAHFTMGAFRSDFYRNLVVSQLPLHEGRRYRVLGSGGVQPLARAEQQMMDSILHCDREGPRDVATAIANEEKKVILQIGENLFRARQGQPQRLRYFGNAHGSPQPGEFTDDMIPHPVVGSGHEVQSLADLCRCLGQPFFPRLPGIARYG